MGNRPTFTLMVFTLNEIDGMRVIMPRIRRDWVDQILVVDGKSTDGTIEYARENGYEIYIQQRKGPRMAYNEAMAHVRGDIVITFSPDGNSIPELIPPLVERMREGYDMVIVSRYLSGARSADDSLLTGFGNWMFRRLINGLHRGRYTDPMVLYRAWRKSLFYELDLHLDESHAPEKWFGTVISIEPLLSVRAARRRLRVAEIPGDEPPRIGGVAKLQPFRWGGAYFAQVVREAFRPGPRKSDQGLTT
jgi:glycosyltransferase involved in cell wall biosynthesis